MSDPEILFEFNYKKGRGSQYISPASPEEFMFLSAIAEGGNDIRPAHVSILRLPASQQYLGMDPQSIKNRFREHSMAREGTVAMIGIIKDPSDRNHYISALMPILAIWGASERQEDLLFGLVNMSKFT